MPSERIQICQCCGAEFQKKKKSMYCSIKCNGKMWHLKSYKKQKEAKPPKPEKETIGECIWCSKPFIKMRKDKVYCSPTCSTLYNNQKRRGTERIKSDTNFLKNLNQTKEFLKEMKRKRYYFDMIDIFKLVHYHAIFYPNKFYADKDSKETIFRDMLLDIMKKIKEEDVLIK